MSLDTLRADIQQNPPAYGIPPETSRRFANELSGFGTLLGAIALFKDLGISISMEKLEEVFEKMFEGMDVSYEVTMENRRVDFDTEDRQLEEWIEFGKSLLLQVMQSSVVLEKVEGKPEVEHLSITIAERVRELQ